ncbi:MAG: hypothetical protein N3B21_05675 [Clostridia bacterium]|nr:hypothetical protein [Clostridia bacterium]
MMIYATANVNPYIPIDNLSTAHKHYRTYTNLCSTTKDTLETCCNLSTATNLKQTGSKKLEVRGWKTPNITSLLSCLRNP